jgi:glucose/arabinose dehydrogenase/mono/diheme cytochrome c family protein
MTPAAAHSVLIAMLALGAGSQQALGMPKSDGERNPGACPHRDAHITLSPGFCATVFADKIGHARHLVVSENGVVYVNTWSGEYYLDRKPPRGGFLVALQDTKGVGKADMVRRFGEGVAQGSAGGTGIALYKGALYAEVNDRIVKYPLGVGATVPTGVSEVVLADLPMGGDHPMHPFTIDRLGDLFVDVGTASNSCQLKNRSLRSPGHEPCDELETRGGIWLYDANKTGQKFAPAERYATGIRNGEGFAFDSDGSLFVTQHGRDELPQNWPDLYSAAEGPELPAEEVLKLERGADYGWPHCYFDGFQKKLVLAPEYGGDGGHSVGVCAKKKAPVATFPAHWAPNDLVIYSGTQFPTPYRQGMFIAFHGSWNRAPAPQAGYNVVYQPMANGAVSGDYVVFADGFAGASMDPSSADHKPSGLAVGPDGALYIADDWHGRIYRITYQGRGATAIAAASAAPIDPSGAASESVVLNSIASLPTPPGATKEQVSLGNRIFHGAMSGGTCSGCHGSEAKGSSMGSDLTSGTWMWGDGSLAAIARTIELGVPNPKHHTGVMPAMGGAQLSSTDVQAVAAYTWAIGHAKIH